MAIKVPIAEERIQTQTPSGVPVARPSAPTGAAFGAEVAESEGRIANAVSHAGDVFASHLLERQKLDADQSGYDSAQRYQAALTAKLHGDGEADVPDPLNPKSTVKIPAALLNRRGNQATINGGILNDLRGSEPSIRASVLAPLKNSPHALRVASRQIDSYYSQAENQVISHQASQDSAAKISAYSAKVNNDTNSMATVVDGADFNKRWHDEGGVAEAISNLGSFSGMLPDKIQELQEKKIAEATDIAVMAKIKQTGSPVAAMLLLNEIKGLPTKDYESTKFKITSQGEAIQRQQEREIVLSQKKNASNYATMALNHMLSQQDIDTALAQGAEGDPKGIDKESYNTLKTLITSKPYEAEVRVRSKLFFGMPEKFFAIQDPENKGDVIPKATFQQISEFRNAALEAYHAGTITRPEVDGKLKKTQEMFDNAAAGFISEDHKNGQAIWKYHNGWLRNYFDYKAPGQKEKIGVGEEEFEQAAGYLGAELMKVMEEAPIKEADVPIVAQAILQKFLIEKHPELKGRIGMPNSVMEAEASFRHVYDGAYDPKSDFKPDFTLKKEVESVGMIEMTNPKTGKKYPIHASQIDAAKQRGLV